MAFCLCRRGKRRPIVVCEHKRLQLSHPVKAGGDRQAWVRLQMPLETTLVEVGVIERAQDRGQAAHRPDELKRWSDNVDL